MLDYASLAALAAVIREGSFERAARSLHVTPSAVSQRVRLLEERLGCALVLRGQPCLPTDAGRRLCHHADQVRLLEHELRSDLPMLGRDDPARVTLPIAVNADSLASWLMPALTDFAAQTDQLLHVAVDHEDHTAEWLRSGAVLAAVTASANPAAGCNARALGAMRYVAAASPQFVQRYFAQGIRAASLALAPSLNFNAKDDLQLRWAGRHLGLNASTGRDRRQQHDVVLPRHNLPSPQAFVAASLAGMGWGMHPVSLIAAHLDDGSLVALAADAVLDVPLYWHQARAAATVLEQLTRAVVAAARLALVQ